MRPTGCQPTREILGSLPQIERAALLLGSASHGGPEWTFNLPVSQLLTYIKNNLSELIKYGR